jgi:2-polyprenyl-3-methyl-5-hydroxy-6-metoxy-1,4-benzoquinol methylase
MPVAEIKQKSAKYADHNLHERGRGFVYAAPERTELFRRYVGGPRRRVLDLGCRDGALSTAYVDGNEVVGLDVDREALAHAARLGLKTEWADLDEPLALDDASFDVVVAGELLEHIRDPAGLVDEAARVLRPGGRIVGSVPNGFRLKHRLRFLAGLEPDEDPTHLHLFSARKIRALLAGWEEPELSFVASRLLRLGPRYFGNTIVFTALKPRR